MRVLNDPPIRGNRAGVGGAGIYMVSGNTLTLDNVNVTDNEADGWGGGVFAWQSNVTIEGNSRVRYNTVGRCRLNR